VNNSFKRSKNTAGRQIIFQESNVQLAFNDS